MTNDSNRGGRRGQLVGSFERRNLTSDQEVPVALEQVLLLASRDRAFRSQLLEDHEAALRNRGLSLRPSESATLAVMPKQVLATTIDSLDTSRQRNKRFAKSVALAAAGTILLSTTSACLCGGIAPDHEPDADQDADVSDSDVDADEPTGD